MANSYRITVSAAAVLTLSLLIGCHRFAPKRPVPPSNTKGSERKHLKDEIVRSPRIRDPFPIRLGMVATKGLSDDPLRAFEPSDSMGADTEKWLALHCDVLAVNAGSIQPETFPRMRKIQELFTPLLFTYASCVYDSPTHFGRVGGWEPGMADWQLKDKSGKPIKHPDADGHWMDPGNGGWIDYYGKHAFALAKKYHADGVIAAELGPANTFADLSKTRYASMPALVDATSQFLQKNHNPREYLLVPSGVGYDSLIGRPTLPVQAGRSEPQLSGRCWDEFEKMLDGAWAEGWIRPYWSTESLPENFWEVQIEAADRSGRLSEDKLSGDIFIAAFAYRNAEELEYGLACYLLASHMQSRLVFQPMPQYPGEPSNAGVSARVMRREYERYKNYFDAPLGIALQERHEIVLGGNSVWRRRFQNGDVYVNSHDSGTCSVDLAAPMMTLDGKMVKTFDLKPHSGIILYNPIPPAAPGKSSH
jgi:hypothetical protein